MTSPVAERLILGLLIAALSSPALGQDIERGHRLAGAWCAACHEIEPARGTSDLAPSFEHLANRPEEEVGDLRSWLVSPHPPMPNLSLANDEVEDLIGYIRSLRHP